RLASEAHHLSPPGLNLVNTVQQEAQLAGSSHERGQTAPTGTSKRVQRPWGWRTSKARTGVCPFTVTSPRSRVSKKRETSLWVASLMTTLPGRASCWRHAARLGVSPPRCNPSITGRRPVDPHAHSAAPSECPSTRVPHWNHVANRSCDGLAPPVRRRDRL